MHLARSASKVLDHWMHRVLPVTTLVLRLLPSSPLDDSPLFVAVDTGTCHTSPILPSLSVTTHCTFHTLLMGCKPTSSCHLLACTGLAMQLPPGTTGRWEHMGKCSSVVMYCGIVIFLALYIDTPVPCIVSSLWYTIL